MTILGAAMLLGSACGQVDVVLTSTGRSALSLANGIIALTVNVGVHFVPTPAPLHHGRGDRLGRFHRSFKPDPAGAAGAVSVRLHPFGDGPPGPHAR